jgi:hypothetical protein
MTNATGFSDLDALYHAGILTDDEYAEASRKLQQREQEKFRPPEFSGVRPTPGGRGRHAKKAGPTWPWFVAAGSVLVLVGVVVTTLLLAKPPHRHAAATAPRPTTSAAASPPAIVAGARVNVPVSINLGGANATVSVARLTPAAGTKTAATFRSVVTAVGVSGLFPLDPSNFTAQASDGHIYRATSTPTQGLTRSLIGAGQRTEGMISFVVPKTVQISAVLFTTSLGEQLAVWSTS